ncbi:MAG: DEAD/DEAH box helicase [Candidatus Babeliaceae bacterium]|nr:DEAD/DEAH box helicase [Candidatus Babeliaceae bacterium]
MSKTDLQDWLLQNSGFQTQYRHLLIDSVASQFYGLQRNSDNTKELYDWKYLLLCASLLAQSETEKCQDTALRIAQYCLECGDTSEVEKHAAAIILDTLANRPAIKLAEVRDLIKHSYFDRLPFPLYQDWVKRSIKNTIALSDDKSLEANRFQCSFWESVNTHDWISISAPTSAGKSFIIGRWLAEYLRNNPQSTVVYIVPTRALIQQVQRDIEGILKFAHVENTSVATLPLKSSLKSDKANIFIFTQERLHVLLAAFNNDISVDLLVIDEAQKIGDNYRGVLLQQAIEAVSCRNPQCRIIFASPMTENPDIMLEDAPDGYSREAIVSEDTMVNQNLIWVSQVFGRPQIWSVELILEENLVEIGRIQLPSSPSPSSKRLPFVAFSLGNPEGGNVIYVNGAADAEKRAKQLYDLIGDDSESFKDKEINDLIELIQKTIHRNYSLGYVLRRGIAFHYGNMPLLVRTEIERLFRENKIKYLVCTSTLIEGVNMPCQSIFVRGPQKGHNKPMNPSDFWNLAGRAGRWGKEFQGNVICVDAKQDNVWKKGAPKRRTKFRIYRTSDKILLQSEDLQSFIDNKTPREEARKTPNLEYVFSYLVSSYIRNSSISSANWACRFPDKLILTLDERIGEIVRKINTPKEVILRNPGISPIAMDNLLEYFNDRTVNRKESVEGLIPVPAESVEAFDEYIKILYRINRYLGNVFGQGNRVRQLALLIVDWMKGYPLARMISSREKYYGCDDLPGLIRNTMKDVEEYARFQAPKYLACYVDLLRVYLEDIERYDLVQRLQELNVLLEFGVSQATQLSLIGLGLSRSSAIAISELIANDSLNEYKCIQWLKENDWMTQDMPELIKREVSNLLNNRSSII